MYLALAQTVAGFFSPYLRMLEIMSMSLSMEIEREAISLIWIGLVIAGSTAWILSTYVGPVVSFIRSPLGRVMKLLHALGYIGLMVCISQLWLVALRFEERTPTEYGSLLPWLSTFATPHVLVRRLMAEIGVAQQSNI